MRRSYKLLVDTKTFNIGSSSSSSISNPTSSSTPPVIPIISLGANSKTIESLLPMDSFSTSSDDEERLRILKDSSKDQTKVTQSRINPTTTTTTTTTTTSTTEKYTDHHIPTVIRSKLTKEENDPTEIYLRNIFYVMVGLIGLLLGIFFVYFSTRSSSSLSKDKLSVDKEELICNEVYTDTRTLHV